MQRILRQWQLKNQHELAHRAQAEIRPLTAQDGVTGSDIENEANALAGILLRLYNQDLLIR